MKHDPSFKGFSFSFTSYQCPWCGWVIAKKTWDHSSRDASCPRCAQNKLSDFVRVEKVGKETAE